VACKLTVRATISPRDPGIKLLQREFRAYKHQLVPRIQSAVRKVVRDRKIRVYAQQKWMLDKQLTEYIRNLPFHPMTFHRQSAWLEADGGFRLHLKTAEGETACRLMVAKKYHDVLLLASGRDNPVLGQVELIEDRKYGRMNAHIVLRLPEPEPGEPRGWLGVDVGWNYLAVSAFRGDDGRSGHVTFHGKDLKTRILRLRYLLKQHQRAGKVVGVWRSRLAETTRYAVGKIAREIVEKAKKLGAGVAMEELTFQSRTKRWLIPRYKLMVAVKTLCAQEGIPFALVPARETSQRCNRCGEEGVRNGKIFTCPNCKYEVNADFNAAVNIAKLAADAAANPTGYTPAGKGVRLHAEAPGEAATPNALMTDERAMRSDGAKPATEVVN